MTKAAASARPRSEWFFTAPTDPVLVRRGDSLGFRAVSNAFADEFAPGLSGRTRDARWITLLCWSLDRVAQARRHYNGVRYAESPGASASAAKAHYSWLRPVELLWIARTLSLEPGEYGRRQLPGQRAVGAWIGGGCRGPRIGLTPFQSDRYRQTGIYGAYRVAFKALPGLTLSGDGWRLDRVGLELAKHVNRELATGELDVPHRRRRHHDAEDFWLKRGWTEWSRRCGQGVLPESSARIRPLLEWERPLLREVLFDGSEAENEQSARRRTVAQACVRASAETHESLCNALSLELGGESEAKLRTLPAVVRLADAGVTAMNAVWRTLHDAKSRTTALSLDALASDDDVARAVGTLCAAAAYWKRQRFGTQTLLEIAGLRVVEALADAVTRASERGRRVLESLLLHHTRHRGGVAWFRVGGGEVAPNVATRPGGGAFYRFRLWPLCRLAVQCGLIARLPEALGSDESEMLEPEGDEERRRS